MDTSPRVMCPDRVNRKLRLALAAKTANARLTVYMKTERTVDPAEGASGEVSTGEQAADKAKKKKINQGAV